MKPKLFIIGSVGIPACYGGFETFAEQISKKLINNFDVTVYCDRSFYKKNERSGKWKQVNRKFLFIPANGVLSVFYDLVSILLSLRTASIILILGIGTGVFMPLFSRVKKVKFITHMDGNEWLRPKWNLIAKKYLLFSARLSVRYSDYIILDNSALLSNIPLKHKKKIIHIEYGGDHLPDVSDNRPVHNKSFALLVCRAEPENNIELISMAFKDISYLDLIIISNWKNTRYERKVKNSIEPFPEIIFMDPIYHNPELLQKYRQQCKIYIHGHSAGGTNPSLVEAMYSGCPILAFDSPSNRNTTQNLAFYFSNPVELAQQVNTLTQNQLLKSAKEMKNYARKFYTWENASLQLQTIL